MEDLFYTVQEVAELLKIHKSTVFAMIRGGKLKAIRIGRLWRVKKEELERMIADDSSGVLQEHRQGV